MDEVDVEAAKQGTSHRRMTSKKMQRLTSCMLKIDDQADKGADHSRGIIQYKTLRSFENEETAEDLRIETSCIE